MARRRWERPKQTLSATEKESLRNDLGLSRAATAPAAVIVAEAGVLSGSTGSADNRLLRSDGSGGSDLQNSPITVDDTGNLSGAAAIDGTSFKVSGTKVVGAQGAAVANATDAATVITQLNTLLSRLRAHGLIAS